MDFAKVLISPATTPGRGRTLCKFERLPTTSHRISITYLKNQANQVLMRFSLNKSLEILERTPSVLASYLSGLSDEWLKQNEGENTWSPYDILGHLIVGEKTDWIVRARIILGSAEDKRFKPFDRFAQLREDQNRSISDMLKEFGELRSDNLEELRAFDITEKQLNLTGIHPEFGEVTLSQLLSTWTIHDLNHISQISRVMARQYKEAVGPWINYLGILKK